MLNSDADVADYRKTFEVREPQTTAARTEVRLL